MIGGGDLGVDIRQCSNLLDISQAGTNPAVADVELDALVEQHRVLKSQQSAWPVSIFINGYLRHHSDAAP